jgi:hypothetical protein
MTIKRIAIITLSTIAGLVLTFVFNFIILDSILIPDPCYYHSHETNKVFDIFYELDEGNHPFPTIFNFIFTLTTGAILGFTFSILKLKKRDKNKTTNR